MQQVRSIMRISLVALACLAWLQATPLESKFTTPASQVFVGAGALLALQQDLTPHSKPTTYPALSVSGRGGYQYRFFTPLIVRLYLDYTMSVRPTGIESIATSHFLVNSDVVSYFYTLGGVDFGVFGGFGLGIGVYGKEVQEDPNALDSVLAKGFSAFVNGGISVLFSKAHRLELGVKYPLTTLTLPSTPARDYQEVHILFMYDYVF
ncbi:outer membrane beta-barrel protein [Helicobacter zhangjianzhongii]|uniref:Outer membrane beta-barrel protein n=1 Tax=Helicobacter zhangjianzhongii TaxID=2974574 RepID=A0ACC6FPW0_9HELI|nr:MULTISPECIES: outer membrane beta-barrel protein [unclassified Helicobacter]MDL0079241.1 outer membrane beta-barrel protein [Helicobacter sp. CPD2-1]MDL0081270.1 outer membrane beta-barrel protein [Helicobacter sp. XJK30-2]